MTQRSDGPFVRGQQVGRYEILALLGSGGMAAVYLARMTTTGGIEREVAIKAIHSRLAHERRFVDMFLDEARITARIHHVNVCAVLDFGEHEGAPYLVMEYLDGVALSRALTRSAEVLPRELAIRALADAARGLQAAHELRRPDGESLQVVHRDVSPHNIVLLYDGCTKVVDFGVARAEGRLSVTMTGVVKGKLAYMAPEQLRSLEVDRRVDVWALGVVLWEATLRRRLFTAAREGDLAVRVLQSAIPRPRDVDPEYPQALDAIVMRALERDPGKRWATAAELADALEDGGRPGTTAQLARWLVANAPRATGVRALLGAAAPEPATTPDGRDPSGSHAITVISPPHGTAPGSVETGLELDGEPSTADLPTDRAEAATTQPTQVRRPPATDRPHARAPLLGLALAAAVAAAIGVVAAFALGPTVAPPRAASHPVAANGPGSDLPNGSSVTVRDAPVPRSAGAASLATRVADAGSPSLETAVRDAGLVAEGAAPRRATREHGTLSVFAIPSARVRTGRRDLGFTPLVARAMAVGRHALELQPTDGSRPYRLVVTVSPGRHTVCRPAAGGRPHCALGER